MGNSSSRKQPTPNPELNKEWRQILWKNRDEVMRNLKDFRPGNPTVGAVRILLNGQVGAGKSSFINSINSIFQGHITTEALADGTGGKSFTKTYKTYTIENRSAPGSNCSFVFNDVMGLEAAEDGGVRADDIISALKGHVKEGYKFNPETALSEGDPLYNSNPNLGDKVHCLVTVVSADNFAIMNDDMVKKQRKIRLAASELGIPQVAVLAKVDMACKLVKEDLKRVYQSRYIKEQIDKFSQKLGIPVNCIVPVQNYNNEIDLNNDVDTLLLSALKHIVNFADDYEFLRAGNNQTRWEEVLHHLLLDLHDLLHLHNLHNLHNLQFLHLLKNLHNLHNLHHLPQIQMEGLSSELGIPVTCIAPVKNYHEEIDRVMKWVCCR
ncbi:hypothetical protein AGOR_G00152370 [Albula goreensis]|uniref:Interferon-induced protein 44-like n=1 Tax=Albula goreensis TaxID=1534307 RepID=A0A8T3D6S6_9TELE|nr:hypothetical protein AGOR_G00152370 [Albula goreensis]